MAVVTPVADAILTKLQNLAVTPALKGYRWAPRDLDAIPAAVIELPRIQRPGPDDLENSPLGTNGWLLDYPVTLYFDLAVAPDAQAQAATYVDAFITAIDDDPSLGLAAVEDSAVTNSEPVIIEERARVLLAYECRLEVLALVVDNDP